MQNPPVSQYRVIRTALVSGVVLFGLVIWYLSGQRTADAPDPAVFRVLLLAFGAVAVGGLVAVAVVRSAQSNATTIAREGTLALVGWAIGESIALFGGVIYLLTSQPALYLVGVMIFLATLLMVPAPEAA